MGLEGDADPTDTSITKAFMLDNGGDSHMFERIKNLLIEELNVDADKITEDAELSGDLGVNSLELADFVLLCEDKFDIQIADEDLHTLITVGDVIKDLEKHGIS